MKIACVPARFSAVVCVLLSERLLEIFYSSLATLRWQTLLPALLLGLVLLLKFVSKVYY